MKNKRPNFSAMNNSNRLTYVSRNKDVMHVMKEFHRQINLIMPEVYSAFAVVLTEKGWSQDQIEELFADTQVLWNELIKCDTDMPTYCLEKTGIDVRVY